MLISTINVLKSHGSQYIKHLDKAVLAETFRGYPIISKDVDPVTASAMASMCPTGAITTSPLALDMGKCLFCGECARKFPSALKFSNNPHTASNKRENLIITADSSPKELFDPESYKDEVVRIFRRSLKLRSVSAGGDGSAEMEANATMNVNFDFGRYGIDFVASPRHADGLVITGPITANMSRSLEICYNALSTPKVLILAGTDAISGGLFADSPAIDRSFLDFRGVDLYIPGNPPHPLTFIDGILTMLKDKY
ncbi:MAG: NADH:ubiquinone oxidoreductase [Rikenellaceae bacterium]